MAVAWYGVKVWKATSPTNEVVYGTRPTHLYTWEMWTITKDDDTTVQVPQRVRPKYQGIDWSVAYNTETSPSTVALLRVVYPDGGDPPIQAEDYIVHLDTENKWNQAMAQYPSLRYRFQDQPYYPAT